MRKDINVFLQNGCRGQNFKLPLPPSPSKLGGRAGGIQQRCHKKHSYQ
jgi:hypothetical protein